MARDVAQRETDQAGLRITNLGTPTAAGDATKTDNTAVPKAASGAGSPGTSLLAAPADHVHPATGESGETVISVSDVSQQSVTGTDEEVIAELLVDFSAIPGGKLIADLSALGRVSEGKATFRLKIGGTLAAADGTEVVSLSTTSFIYEGLGGTSEPFDRPEGPELVKLTAVTDAAGRTGVLRGKHILFRRG